MAETTGAPTGTQGTVTSNQLDPNNGGSLSYSMLLLIAAFCIVTPVLAFAIARRLSARRRTG